MLGGHRGASERRRTLKKAGGLIMGLVSRSVSGNGPPITFQPRRSPSAAPWHPYYGPGRAMTR